MDATVRMARDGMLSYESDILATVNLITTFNRVFKTKPSIEKLKDGMKQL